MRHPKPHSPLEKGFTLLEVMMSLGLASLVSFAVYALWVGSQKQIQTMETDIENYTDVESGQRIMLRDLKNIDPSFGALSLRDDNGHTLFEYFPDVSEGSLLTKYGAESKCPKGYPLCRIYTLAPGKHAEIVFIMHDPTAHEIPSMVYDPTMAYDQAPKTGYNNGSISFGHVNQKQPSSPIYIGNPTCPMVAGGSPPSCAGNRPRIVSSSSSGVVLYPGYWRKQALLMFDTPTLYRSATMVNPVDEAPRPAFFVGQVADDAPRSAFNALDPTQVFVNQLMSVTKEQANLLDRRHPVQPTSITVDSADTFFRSVPPVGGGQPLIRLRPVRLVKYTIEKMYPEITDSEPNVEKRKKKDLLRVWRHVYSNGWDRAKYRSLVAENVKGVQFRRNSVTEKALLFTISRIEVK